MTDCRADHLNITQVQWFLLLSSLASQAGRKRTDGLGVSAVSATWLTALCLPLLPRFLPLSFWHAWPPSPALLPRRGEVRLWLWCPCEIPGDHMSHGGDERGLEFAGHSQAFHLHAHTHGNFHDRSSRRCTCMHHTGKSMQNKKHKLVAHPRTRCTRTDNVWLKQKNVEHALASILSAFSGRVFSRFVLVDGKWSTICK